MSTEDDDAYQGDTSSPEHGFVGEVQRLANKQDSRRDREKQVDSSNRHHLTVTRDSNTMNGIPGPLQSSSEPRASSDGGYRHDHIVN